MNILILNWRDTKHSWAGGSELYIHELAKRWVKQENKVTLFCGQDIVSFLPEKEVIDGINIIRKGGKFSVYLWAFIYYFKYFRKNTDLIIDVENGVPFFTPFYSRKKKICLVYHVHAEQFFYELGFPLNIIGFLLEKYVFPLVYRNIPILAISKTTKNELVKLRFKKEKITVVYPGVDLRNRVNHEAKYKKPTILYLGRIKKYKRIDKLIHVFEKIYKLNPKARLMIAGWGSEAPMISDFVMKSKLRKSIDIMGPVSENEKAKLYAKAWVFVNPSLHEGWGISVIEANLHGTPAVAFKVTGLSDSIVDGKTGYLCKDELDMANKILTLIDNKPLLQRFSKQSREWALKFDWDNAADKSLKLIETIYKN